MNNLSLGMINLDDHIQLEYWFKDGVKTHAEILHDINKKTPIHAIRSLRRISNNHNLASGTIIVHSRYSFIRVCAFVHQHGYDMELVSIEKDNDYWYRNKDGFYIRKTLETFTLKIHKRLRNKDTIVSLQDIIPVEIIKSHILPYYCI